MGASLLALETDQLVEDFSLVWSEEMGEKCGSARNRTWVSRLPVGCLKHSAKQHCRTSTSFRWKNFRQSSLPRATLIQFSDVRMNYFEVQPEILLATLPKGTWTSQPVLNLMRLSSSKQPIKFTVTALIPCGRGSNQSRMEMRLLACVTRGPSRELLSLKKKKILIGARENEC